MKKRKRKTEKNNSFLFQVVACVVVFVLLYIGIPRIYGLMKESSFRETMSSLESNIPVSTDLSELVNRTAVENHCYIQITNQDGTLNYQSPVIAMNQSQLYETNSTTSSGTAVQVSVQFSQDDVLFLNHVLLISLPLIGLILIGILALIQYLRRSSSQDDFTSLRQASEDMLALKPRARLKLAGASGNKKRFVDNMNALYQQLIFSLETNSNQSKENRDTEEKTLHALKAASQKLKVPVDDLITLVNNMIQNKGQYRNHQVYLIEAKVKLEDLKETLAQTLENGLTESKAITIQVDLKDYFARLASQYETNSLHKKVHIQCQIEDHLPMEVNDLLFRKAFDHMMHFILAQVEEQSTIIIQNDHYEITIAYQGACLTNKSIQTVLDQDEDLKQFHQLLQTLQFYCDFERTPKKDGMQFIFHF